MSRAAELDAAVARLTRFANGAAAVTPKLAATRDDVRLVLEAFAAYRLAFTDELAPGVVHGIYTCEQDEPVARLAGPPR